MASLPGRLAWLLVVLVAMVLSGCGGGETGVGDLDVPEDVVARVVLFSADDCAVCSDLRSGLLAPLQDRCGAALELKVVPIGEPDGYEAFVATEALIVGEAGRWDVPTVVVEDVAFVGESAIRSGFLEHLKCVFGAGGNGWPAGDVLQSIAAEPVQDPDVGSPFAATGEELESCVDDEASAVCATGAPIFALYLSDAACTDTCERTRYDLAYLQGVYPQLVFEERQLQDNGDLAAALAERLGVAEDRLGRAPAVVVGDDYLVDDDLLLANLRERIGAYVETGATATWYLIELD